MKPNISGKKNEINPLKTVYYLDRMDILGIKIKIATKCWYKMILSTREYAKTGGCSLINIINYHLH